MAGGGLLSAPLRVQNGRIWRVNGASARVQAWFKDDGWPAIVLIDERGRALEAGVDPEKLVYALCESGYRIFTGYVETRDGWLPAPRLTLMLSLFDAMIAELSEARRELAKMGDHELAVKTAKWYDAMLKVISVAAALCRNPSLAEKVRVSVAEG